MAIEITHVRMLIGGQTHEQIMGCKWTGIDFAQAGSADVPSLVDWITNRGGTAYVGRGPDAVAVGVIRPDDRAPYLRAHTDAAWTDCLIALPRF